MRRIDASGSGGRRPPGALLREAGLEVGHELGAVEVAADEHEGVAARFPGRPRAIGGGTEDHVHALEYDALLRAAHGQYAFRGDDVGAFLGEQAVEPGVELFRVKVAVAHDADGGVCDCALKSVEELRAPTRQGFGLTAAYPTVWSHRRKDTLFVRVGGELVPAPLPSACCAP